MVILDGERHSNYLTATWFPNTYRVSQLSVDVIRRSSGCNLRQSFAVFHLLLIEHLGYCITGVTGSEAVMSFGLGIDQLWLAERNTTQ